MADGLVRGFAHLLAEMSVDRGGPDIDVSQARLDHLEGSLLLEQMGGVGV